MQNQVANCDGSYSSETDDTDIIIGEQVCDRLINNHLIINAKPTIFISISFRIIV